MGKLKAPLALSAAGIPATSCLPLCTLSGAGTIYTIYEGALYILYSSSLLYQLVLLFLFAANTSVAAFPSCLPQDGQNHQGCENNCRNPIGWFLYCATRQ